MIYFGARRSEPSRRELQTTPTENRRTANIGGVCKDSICEQFDPVELPRAGIRREQGSCLLVEWFYEFGPVSEGSSRSADPCDPRVRSKQTQERVVKWLDASVDVNLESAVAIYQGSSQSFVEGTRTSVHFWGDSSGTHESSHSAECRNRSVS